jgi:hypothetical protein
VLPLCNIVRGVSRACHSISLARANRACGELARQIMSPAERVPGLRSVTTVIVDVDIEC